MGAAAWLADRAGAALARSVERMPAGRKEWGQALVAELAAAPDPRARLRWAVSGLWFVLGRGRRAPVAPPVNGGLPVTFLRRVYALLGAGPVGFWAYASWLGLQDDAPDLPRDVAISVLVAQLVVLAAFLLNWWLPRAGLLAVWIAVPAYGLVVAYGAVSPLLAGAVFAGPSLLAAGALQLVHRHG
jgi:hypothetical protein